MIHEQALKAANISIPLECDQDGDIRDAAGDIIATVRERDGEEIMLARGRFISEAVNKLCKIKELVSFWRAASNVMSEAEGDGEIRRSLRECAKQIEDALR